MAAIKKIKVIKRSDGRSTTLETDATGSKKATREMIGNVSNWVSELRERKRSEARAAMKLLFGPSDMSET